MGNFNLSDGSAVVSNSGTLAKYTLAEMRAAVQSRSDEGTETDIIQWLNAGYMSLAEVAEIPESATFSFIAAAYQEEALPVDYVKLSNVLIDSLPLDEIHIDAVDDATGTPTSFYINGNKIGLYPKPDTDVDCVLNYFKYPSKLVSDNSVPHQALPIKYYDAIINFAIARAKEVDEEYQAAAYFMGQFKEAKQELFIERFTEHNAPIKMKVR